MPITPHYRDAIQFSLFLREQDYGVAPAWSTGACAMPDYDDHSPHAIWDDTVDDNDILLHEAEYPTRQALVRQSVRLTYTEPYGHPNTLGGLLTLALGNRVTAQDGALPAYRHAISPAATPLSFSMAGHIAHSDGAQYLYTGIKADHLSLRNNGPFVSLSCDLIGAGIRTITPVTPLPFVDDPWLKWGDCRIWLKDVTGTPLTLPDTPVQGNTNLGAGAVDISTRVLRLEYLQPCTLWAEGGYRPSSHQVRASLMPTRRSITILLTLEADSVTQATELDYYLLQRQLALEWQCVGALIANGGTFRYGFTILLPAMQFRRLRFGAQDELDYYEYEATVLEDTVNPGIQTWVYTSEPEYLGSGMVPECSVVPEGLIACWDMNEASGVRVEHVGVNNDLTPRNDPLGVPSQAGNAVQFVKANQQYLYNPNAVSGAFLAAFTLYFRVRYTTTPAATSGLITNGNSTFAGQFEYVVLAQAGGQILIVFNRGFGGVITSAAALTTNVWHQVLIWRTFSGFAGTLSMQIDAGTVQNNNFSNANVQASARFCIGATGGIGGAAQDYFDGDLDTVRVWNRVLTAEERTIVNGSA